MGNPLPMEAPKAVEGRAAGEEMPRAVHGESGW
jgi:hypothetical protein